MKRIMIISGCLTVQFQLLKISYCNTFHILQNENLQNVILFQNESIHFSLNISPFSLKYGSNGQL